MFVSVDKNLIFNIFGANTFCNLESILDNMSPSLIEYHLSGFLNSENLDYFDKKNIETTFRFGSYNLHIDYNKDMFIEANEIKKNEQTLSFW